MYVIGEEVSASAVEDARCFQVGFLPGEESKRSMCIFGSAKLARNPQNVRIFSITDEHIGKPSFDALTIHFVPLRSAVEGEEVASLTAALLNTFGPLCLLLEPLNKSLAGSFVQFNQIVAPSKNYLPNFSPIGPSNV